MNIYLVRHGDAERTTAGSSDFERELTREGIIQLRVSAEKWKNLVTGFDYIVTSPLVRAVQTAKIIAEVFDYKNEIIKDERLGGGGETQGLIEIADALDGDDFLFVGHQPDFSQHVSDFISSGFSRIEFKKAAIAKISFHNRIQLSKGVLEFLIPPVISK
jgi:phosphohistidine phosphatase